MMVKRETHPTHNNAGGQIADAHNRPEAGVAVVGQGKVKRGARGRIKRAVDFLSFEDEAAAQEQIDTRISLGEHVRLRLTKSGRDALEVQRQREMKRREMLGLQREKVAADDLATEHRGIDGYKRAMASLQVLVSKPTKEKNIPLECIEAIEAPDTNTAQRAFLQAYLPEIYNMAMQGLRDPESIGFKLEERMEAGKLGAIESYMIACVILADAGQRGLEMSVRRGLEERLSSFNGIRELFTETTEKLVDIDTQREVQQRVMEQLPLGYPQETINRALQRPLTEKDLAKMKVPKPEKIEDSIDPNVEITLNAVRCLVGGMLKKGQIFKTTKETQVEVLRKHARNLPADAGRLKRLLYKSASDLQEAEALTVPYPDKLRQQLEVAFGEIDAYPEAVARRKEQQAQQQAIAARERDQGQARIDELREDYLEPVDLEVLPGWDKLTEELQRVLEENLPRSSAECSTIVNRVRSEVEREKANLSGPYHDLQAEMLRLHEQAPETGDYSNERGARLLNHLLDLSLQDGGKARIANQILTEAAKQVPELSDSAQDLKWVINQAILDSGEGGIVYPDIGGKSQNDLPSAMGDILRAETRIYLAGHAIFPPGTRSVLYNSIGAPLSGGDADPSKLLAGGLTGVGPQTARDIRRAFQGEFSDLVVEGVEPTILAVEIKHLNDVLSFGPAITILMGALQTARSPRQEKLVALAFQTPQVRDVLEKGLTRIAAAAVSGGEENENLMLQTELTQGTIQASRPNKEASPDLFAQFASQAQGKKLEELLHQDESHSIHDPNAGHEERLTQKQLEKRAGSNAAQNLRALIANLPGSVALHVFKEVVEAVEELPRSDEKVRFITHPEILGIVQQTKRQVDEGIRTGGISQHGIEHYGLEVMKLLGPLFKRVVASPDKKLVAWSAGKRRRGDEVLQRSDDERLDSLAIETMLELVECLPPRPDSIGRSVDRADKDAPLYFNLWGHPLPPAIEEVFRGEETDVVSGIVDSTATLTQRALHLLDAQTAILHPPDVFSDEAKRLGFRKQKRPYREEVAVQLAIALTGEAFASDDEKNELMTALLAQISLVRSARLQMRFKIEEQHTLPGLEELAADAFHQEMSKELTELAAMSTGMRDDARTALPDLKTFLSRLSAASGTRLDLRQKMASQQAVEEDEAVVGAVDAYLKVYMGSAQGRPLLARGLVQTQTDSDGEWGRFLMMPEQIFDALQPARQGDIHPDEADTVTHTLESQRLRMLAIQHALARR